MEEEHTSNSADSRYACSAADIAADIIRGNIRHGVVTRWESNTGSSLIDTVDPEFLPSGMAKDGGSRCQEACGRSEAFHGGK